jgi:Type-F conjugative transfer system protein (TrbI_Ftype)
MENISATSLRRARFGDFSPAKLALAFGAVGALLWGAWATQKLVALDRRQIVTVELARVIGTFVDAEARAGHSPEETRARIAAYLKAVDAAAARLSRDGRTVLVAEAVVAGSAPDMTKALRADVAKRMEALDRGAR